MDHLKIIRAFLVVVVLTGFLSLTWDVLEKSIFVAANGQSLLDDWHATKCGMCASPNTMTDQDGGRCCACGAAWLYSIRPDRRVIVLYVSHGELGDVTSRSGE